MTDSRYSSQLTQSIAVINLEIVKTHKNSTQKSLWNGIVVGQGQVCVLMIAISTTSIMEIENVNVQSQLFLFDFNNTLERLK